MIKKLLRSIRKDGICLTVRKIIKVISIKISKKNSSVLKGVIDPLQFDTIIIFENNFCWNKIMKQRPQQMAENLPANILMIYHSHDDKDYDNKKRIRLLKNNLFLIDIGYYRDEIFKLFANHFNKYLMIYSTDYIPYERIELYKNYGYKILYEYVDDINEKLTGKDIYSKLNKRHQLILRNNPYTVCTANNLYNKVVNKIKYVKLISNGVNYEHFAKRNIDIPSDLISIKEKHNYIICYYGALASWFDYKLLKKIAINNKKIGILLIGQNYDNSLEESNILKLDNIYYLGKKDYNDLPSYGMNVDLFMIPFCINNITKSTNPVKIFEYMAMEKPIIVTALPECKKYKSVLYSKNHEEFMKNIDYAIKLIDNQKYMNILKNEAKSNIWESKAKELVEFINASKYDEIKTEINDILNNNKYSRIVIWRSPFGWNVPLFQRPQHIAKEMSKLKTLVFYEVTCKTDAVREIKKKYDNLYLINLENYYIKKILFDELKKIKCYKYLQIYSTNWSMSLNEMLDYKNDGFNILYEYIDDISPDLAGSDEIPQYILDKHNYALTNKDILIVTTAKILYDNVLQKRGKLNLIFSSNGVDYNFFKQIDKKYKFEASFLKIIENGKINICYYGALASWFDYELIKKVNETGLYNIILFGIKYDDSFDKSKIEKLKNVYYLGSKKYNVLKNYANKMDILIIPFKVNSITQATSPLKLFEYMALGKPIVTTAMNECKKYKSVLIAENSDDFLKKLKKCQKIKNNKKYLKLLDDEAEDNDWSKKALSIINLLGEVEEKKN